MIAFLFFLPVLDSLVFWILFYYTFKFLKDNRSTQQELKKILLEKLEEGDFESFVEPFLDKRIDSFLQKIRALVPMSSVFLSNSLLDRFKSQGKGEILKMIPEAKTALLNKIDNDFSKGLSSLNLQPLLYKIGLYGAILGFIVGIFHATLIALVYV